MYENTGDILTFLKRNLAITPGYTNLPTKHWQFPERRPTFFQQKDHEFLKTTNQFGATPTLTFIFNVQMLCPKFRGFSSPKNLAKYFQPNILVLSPWEILQVFPERAAKFPKLIPNHNTNHYDHHSFLLLGEPRTASRCPLLFKPARDVAIANNPTPEPLPNREAPHRGDVFIFPIVDLPFFPMTEF